MDGDAPPAPIAPQLVAVADPPDPQPPGVTAAPAAEPVLPGQPSWHQPSWHQPSWHQRSWQPWPSAPPQPRARRFWVTRRLWLPKVTVAWLLTPLEHVRVPRPRQRPPGLVRPGRPARRLRRVLLAVAAAAGLAAAGVAAWAFVTWGPVGLGNGPVFLPAAAGEGFGWTDLTGQPAAVIVPVINAGHATAVVDSVAVQSGLSDVPARVLAVRAGRFTRFPCQAIGPLHASVIPSGPRSGHVIASALTGCVRPGLAPVAGLALAPGTNAMGIDGWPVNVSPAGATGTALVLVLARPGPGQCWSVAAVVIRYHVGSRHYTSTSPLGQAFACAPDARPSQ